MLIAVWAIGLNEYKNGSDSSVAANMKAATSVCMTGYFNFFLMKAMIGTLRYGISRIG